MNKLSLEKIINIVNDFCHTSGIGVFVTSSDGSVIYSHARVQNDEYIKLATQNNLFDECMNERKRAISEAKRFGGKYIYNCSLGLTHAVSVVLVENKVVLALFSSPIVMGEPREPFPLIPPSRVRAISEQLFVTAAYLSPDMGLGLEDKQKNQNLQAIISDYIQEIKEKGVVPEKYPLETEQALLSAISSGDREQAQMLLNEMLGYIYFHAGGELSVVKTRILELLVLLSRAAIKGGAQAERILELNNHFLEEINTFENMDDLTYWLSKVMQKFNEFIFNNVRHVSVIRKSIKYINKNYMDKITLADVAGHVFLSPSYFSKIFKEELGENFNSYLNRVRVEKSKQMLMSEGVDLVDIANLTGFEDQSYFSKVFKKNTGMSPLQYRNYRRQS